MNAENPRMRPATPDDAAILSEIINHAGEGLPVYLWTQMAAPGQSPWDVGRARAQRETGSFSYRNAIVAEHDGRAVGSLIGYGIGVAPEPLTADTPAMFVPLLELENLAAGTWYVNVLAVLPGFRNLGIGAVLLHRADEIGRECGKRGMSIIVTSDNGGARRLYERHGYRETAKRTMMKENWVKDDRANDGKEWVLLEKAL